MAGGPSALLELAMATHAEVTTEEAEVTTEEFQQIARDGISTFRHPQTGKLLTEMAQQLLERARQRNVDRNLLVAGDEHAYGLAVAQR